MSRNVFFDLSPSFYKSPPNCITVLAVAGTKDRRFASLVEKTAARHLSGRVRRVIGSLERQRSLRKMALDLGNPSDRRRYVSQTRCRFFVVVTINNAAEDYFVVWSQREIKLSIELFRQKSGKRVVKKSGKWSSRYSKETGNAKTEASWERVWRATHTAQRSEGGLPTSALSIGVNAFNAGRAHNDKDAMPSMIDDAFRRMIVTLPDTRVY